MYISTFGAYVIVADKIDEEYRIGIAPLTSTEIHDVKNSIMEAIKDMLSTQQQSQPQRIERIDNGRGINKGRTEGFVNW